MRVVLSPVGEGFGSAVIADDVAVRPVTDPEVFSARAGIRVLPFTLIMANGGQAVAVGLGLPDVSFIRSAAKRFVRDGARAATTFRPVTAEVNSGLTPVDILVPSGTVPR
jgi:hypothetical protein